MRFVGRCYRAHDPRWSYAPVSGAGAATTGARFNVVGQPALYLALDPLTALAECTQGFAARMLPLTLCEYDIDCEDVVDLTNPAIRRVKGVDPGDMACSWLRLQRTGKPVPSQRIAARFIDEGVAGAIVPSFVPGIGQNGRNLVLWQWGDTFPYRATVFDPAARLPEDQSSWC